MSFEGQITIKGPSALKVELQQEGQELQQDCKFEKSNYYNRTRNLRSQIEARLRA